MWKEKQAEEEYSLRRMYRGKAEYLEPQEGSVDGYTKTGITILLTEWQREFVTAIVQSLKLGGGIHGYIRDLIDRSREEMDDEFIGSMERKKEIQVRQDGISILNDKRKEKNGEINFDV